MAVPKDPAMLLSFLNLKLRDFYSNLDELCMDLGVERQDVVEKLKTIDYEYDSSCNQFI